MWADNQTERDFLNFKCVADTAAELIIKANGQPLSMGVSGGWGVGKSSMLKLISESLHSAKDDKYLFVEFNAWLYQGFDDARAALMDVIARSLIEHAQKSKTGLDKAKDFFKRVDWLRFTGMVFGASLSLAAGIPPTGLLGNLIGFGKGAFGEGGFGGVNEENVEGLSGNIQDGIATARDLISKPIKESPPQQIQDLRNHFEETLREMEITLVVFIDDLDRCLPQTTIATLEAIRLFLFLPNTAFIIAADDRMIREAVRVHFRDTNLDNDLVTNYFDKLVQIPIRVPPLGTQDVRAYMMLLYVENSELADDQKETIRSAVCKQLSESWKGKRVDTKFMHELISDCPDGLKQNIELADRLAHLMSTAKQIAGNPRLIKRFLNTLSIRLSIAKSQGITIDEAALAKMLLFERCVEERAYAELLQHVNESDSGKPEFLKDWENKSIAGESIIDLPVHWNSEFAKNWFALQPALSDIDLRPILYVSREHMPLITPADQLSSEAAEIMEALLMLTRQCLPVLLNKVKSLSGRDISMIMDRLLIRAKRETKWGTPPVFFAMLAVTEADQNMTNKFVDFLKHIPVSQLQPDVIMAISDRKWCEDVTNIWKCKGDIPQTVKNAINGIGKEK